MSGTAERKTIQQPARRRRWFLTPSARKETRVNSACAYGARRDGNQVLATKDPTRICVQGVGFGEPARAARSNPEYIHRNAQKITERSVPHPAASQIKLLCPSAIFCGCNAVLRESKTKITLTTDFTDHTDEERPESISVQSVSSVVQVFVVEIFVVHNDVASDAKRPRRTHVGRSSDAKWEGARLPQVVPSIRVRVQY